ncbi:uncharacterized protein LOC110240287 [Exaiptasia diaphana]|uniref:Ubiquitin-like domain-containing protein n=1 Tax=Exaiptasia diaphana TaxID=2652724 RepID=A0A913XB33_EXADI|nr:uncharacterized protein LOC110240287 [Exaiptasia diaphana]KXJ13451.1 Ubiquitin-60S ribosomal protein L40 [Exaiptasia diaphana]
MSMSEADLELISAGFTAIVGFQVVPPSRGHGLPKLTVQELFNCTYTPRSLKHVDPGKVFEINVKSITGSSFTVEVTYSHTIADIKANIEIKQNIPAKDIRLMFDGKPVEDDQSVLDLGIPSGGVLYLLVRLRGGGPDFQLDLDQFDPSYNFDFTSEEDDGQVFVRGGKVYKRPYGWRRFAVQALGRYENDIWLGPNGIRTQEAQGEWPVCYHGTNLQSARAIMDSGFKIGAGDRFGKAVYSSPSLDMVERLYAQRFEHEGSTFKIALQNRINPSPGHFVIIPAEQTGVGAEYWLSPHHDAKKKIDDLRPYGLLFKKVS